MEIIWAIILGTIFGFVLQRIGAADPEKIIGMLRLTDMHLAKTILTAIGVSSGLLFVGMLTGVIDAGHLSIKTMNVGVLIGGAILGLGWGLSGFCPGTGVVAVGSGRKDAIFFIIGGLVGAGLFMILFSLLDKTGVFTDILGGAVTLAKTTDKADVIFSNLHGAIVAGVIGVAMIIIAWILPKSIR